eukprot:scaffold551064_cov20-Prasinocladus_malaysianus.AAC.1
MDDRVTDGKMEGREDKRKDESMTQVHRRVGTRINSWATEEYQLERQANNLIKAAPLSDWALSLTMLSYPLPSL